MNVTTRFNVGDKVCTLTPDTLTLREFEVDSVLVYTNDKGKTSIYYYAKSQDGSYSSERYEEKACFASKGELLSHINDSGVKA